MYIDSIIDSYFQGILESPLLQDLHVEGGRYKSSNLLT